MHPGIKYFSVSLCLALVLAGCSSKPTPPTPEPPKVTVSKPIVKKDQQDFEEYNGTLIAKDPVQIRSRVRGFVKEIFFKDPPEDKPGEGELVKKGTPLFELDEDEFLDRIVLAKEQVNVAKARKEAADKELVRVTELEKKGGASKAQVEKAEADVKSLAAEIKKAEAEVSLRERDLKEYSKIKAPIEGRISRSNVSKGELVTAGEPLLTTINSVDPIKVEFDMDDPSVQRHRKRFLSKAKDSKLPTVREVKIPFWFKLDTDPDFIREGFLDFADNQSDTKTGKIRVRGETKNANGLLLPGNHVRVRVPVSDKYQALLVPDTAVNTDQDEKYLFVIDGKNGVQRRDVRLGKLRDNGLRVIETNLKPTDRVIIEGTQRARIGHPVTPEDKDLTEEMKKLERP